jgi:hypothetical protein
MASFGSFEAIREVYSGPVFTVFSARKSGDPKTEYAVKVFSVRQLGLDLESEAQLDPLLTGLESSCLERVSLQQKAAAASKFICPILERGQDERGVWYATAFYPRSVNKMITGHVALGQSALRHVLASVAQGALDLKRTCGRSHGDIQPSAVQVSRSEKLADAAVVLSDPLPGGPNEAGRYELSDLRAIGRILLQLVLQREISHEEDFDVLLPIAASPEWLKLFDKTADVWVSLCNRLLAPDLTLGPVTLEKLVEELEQLRVKPRVSRTQILVAAVIALLAAVAGVVAVMHFKRGNLLVTTDPPGAEIKLKSEGKGEYQSVGKTPLDNGPLVLKGLAKGRYSLKAEYPALEDKLSDVAVEGGKTRPYQLVFSYGVVKLTSTPNAAAVELDGKPVGATPYTSPFLPPGRPQSYILRLTDHIPARVALVVPPGGQSLAIHTNLAQIEAGTAVVEFTSRPDAVKITENGVELCTAPAFKTLKIGRHTITAVFEDWPTKTVEIDVKAGDNQIPEIVLPHGQARFSVTPAEAQISLNNKPIGRGVRTRPLQPGDYAIKLELEGYYPTNGVISVRDGQITNFAMALVPMLGFVELSSDPPGATVYEMGAATPLGTAKEGEPVKRFFKPGSYTFYGRFEDLDLDPVTNKPVTIAMGARLSQVLAFNYATVRFETEPPGAQALISGRATKSTPYVYRQRPGPIAYRLELPDYYPAEGRTNLQSGAPLQIAWRLRRKDVALVLRSEPPGAEFFMEGVPLTGTNDGRYLVPWGTHSISARFLGPPELPALEPVTNSVQVDKNGTSSMTFTFSYATFEITNIETEARLLYQDKPVAALTNLPVTLYLKPNLQYDFAIDGGLEFHSNLPPVKLAAATRFPQPLTLPELSRTLKNSIGMKLEWVPGLPGGGDWGDLRHTNGGWVGVFEVTQAQYQEVMKANPSVYKCPDVTLFPVENVTWDNAVEFCKRLPPEGPKTGAWQYKLPTDAQYEAFAADADTAGKVTSQGLSARREHPEKVGSGKRNKHRLYDVVGNVAEWVDAPPAANKGRFYRGGSYESVAGYKASTRDSAREANQDNHPTVGFRVLLVPAR